MSDLTLILIGTPIVIALSFLVRIIPVKEKSSAPVMLPGYGSEYYSQEHVFALFQAGKCKRWPYLQEARAVMREHNVGVATAIDMVCQSYGEATPARIIREVERIEHTVTQAPEWQPATLRPDAFHVFDRGDTIKLNLPDYDPDYPTPVELPLGELARRD